MNEPDSIVIPIFQMKKLRGLREAKDSTKTAQQMRLRAGI